MAQQIIKQPNKKLKMIYYKGKGEHSVRELERIVEEQFEELHLIKSGQKQPETTAIPEIVGKQFKHKNGNTYTVLYLTNTDSTPKRLKDHPIDVVYVGQNGKVWSRPLHDWARSFTIKK